MADDPKKPFRWDEDDDEVVETTATSSMVTQEMPTITDPPPWARSFDRLSREEPQRARLETTETEEVPSPALTVLESLPEFPEPVDTPPGVDGDPSGPWDFTLHATPDVEQDQAASGEEELEVQDDEPFDRPDAQKLGIVGGKGVGKTYLFQAMVYRSYAGTQSGALTYYLENDGMHLFIAHGEQGDSGRRIARTGAASTLNRADFIKKYRQWERLDFTKETNQHWYRLRLDFRTGLLGRTRSAMDVEFFDGSGEGLIGATQLTDEDREVWDRAYLTAGVMVFCFPLWAAFPGNDLTDEEWATRDQLISGLEQVIKNYNDMRRRHNERKPVTSILALTMSDDRRSALQSLYGRWISPYLDSPNTYLKQLRRGTGIARYLSNARKISEALHEEFASVSDPRIASIPQSLDFGRGVPWMVALSAIDGARLDQIEKSYPNPDDPRRLREVRGAAPVPVHVELPLLVALCERENALM
ncbi:MAG TPA: hypothetical protein VGQ76_14225 [Thermoanaerobaculia bacterium]|jgi:hypothetical protein|nr:hypothetical protein [Thermoanaerobaculia bacterium]